MRTKNTVAKLTLAEIHSGHKGRIRRDARINGLSHLEEYKFLEYLLSFPVVRKDTNELAHRLINHFGSLINVLTAPYEALVNFEGLGEASATFLCTQLQIVNYINERTMANKPAITSTAQAIEILKSKFKPMNSEKFIMAMMDSKDTIIHIITSKMGERDKIDISCKELQDIVKKYNAKKILIAHNHPSGDITPSEADISFTKTLYMSMYFVGVELVDHCIIVADDYFSFRSHRYIDEYRSTVNNLLQGK